MLRSVKVSHRDYVIDNGVDEDDALTYPLFSTSTMVSLSLIFLATTFEFSISGKKSWEKKITFLTPAGGQGTQGLSCLA